MLDHFGQDMLSLIGVYLPRGDILALFMTCMTLRKSLQHSCLSPFRRMVLSPDRFVRLCRDTRRHVRFLRNWRIASPDLNTLCPRLESVVFAREFNASIRMRQFKRVVSLVIGEHFQQELTPKDLPIHLESLVFTNGPGRLSFFNRGIRIGVLPPALRSIRFGYSFNKPLPHGVLPPALLTLHLGYKHDLPLNQICFPPGLRELSLGDKFACEITSGDLPTSLLRLSIGTQYNRSIGSLPRCLQSLVFKPGGVFNTPVITLPPAVVHLDLGDAYTHEIPPCPGLQELAFGTSGEFNRRLVLPCSLEKLTLSHRFDRDLGASLCHTRLRKLVLGTDFNAPISPGTFPSTLEEIHFGVNFVHSLQPGLFHAGLKRLTFDRFSRFNCPLARGSLPETLVELRFGSCFDNTIAWLPNSLETMMFGRRFMQDLPNIPSALKSIQLSFRSQLRQNKNIRNLPPGLVHYTQKTHHVRTNADVRRHRVIRQRI